MVLLKMEGSISLLTSALYSVVPKREAGLADTLAGTPVMACDKSSLGSENII